MCDQKRHGKERVYLLDTSTSQCSIRGSRGRSSSRDLEAAWTLLLEVCGSGQAEALPELGTRRQHPWITLAWWETVADV